MYTFKRKVPEYSATVRQVYCDDEKGMNKWLKRNKDKIEIISIKMSCTDTKEFGFVEMIMVDYIALVDTEEIK